MKRRQFLQTAAGIKPSEALIQSAAATLDPWKPSSENPWDISAANHLYHRLGFGATYGELQIALKSSPAEIVRSLMDDHLVTDRMPDPPEGWERWLIVPPYRGDVHELHQEE